MSDKGGRPFASARVSSSIIVKGLLTTVILGAPVGGKLTIVALTVMLKLESCVDVVPSLTRILILLYVPTSRGPGVPDSWPVVLLKLAQLGLF